MCCVAPGVEDCPELAHHGHVQLGTRYFLRVVNDVVSCELRATGSSILGQCTAARGDKMLASMSSSVSASSSGLGRTRGEEGVVFRMRSYYFAE